MMKLYEIDAAILDCIDLETGEIVDEAALDALQIERERKVEGVALWVKQLQAEAAALKAEKDAFAERQKVAENKAESLKKWLAYALDGNKFETTLCKVSFRRSKVVEVDNVAALMAYDDNLLAYKEPAPKKAAIKQAIAEGRNVPGVRLVEHENVLIK